MCLQITGHKEGYIALEDIPVLKGVDVYYNRTEDRMAYESPVFVKYKWSKGLHEVRLGEPCFGGIHQGLHAFMSYPNHGHYVLRAVIPKGAEFYLGTYYEVVSNQLRIDSMRALKLYLNRKQVRLWTPWTGKMRNPRVKKLATESCQWYKHIIDGS